jgi:hypothetical protein
LQQTPEYFIGSQLIHFTMPLLNHAVGTAATAPDCHAAIVDAAATAPAPNVTTVNGTSEHRTIVPIHTPAPATKPSRKKDLPPYFLDLPRAEARKCLLKLDSKNPNRVTHLTAILYSEVDPNNSDHYIPLDTAILDLCGKL